MKRRPQYGYLDNGGKVIAVAHAGGNIAGLRKQNTMAAFEAAYNLGYRYAETDLLRSADNRVVMCHGALTFRQQLKTGLPLRSWIQDMTYKEITCAVSAGGERFPLLEEVLSSFPDMKFNLEPKTREVVAPLGKLLARRRDLDSFCIASIYYAYTKGVVDEIREFKGRNAQVCTASGPLGILAAKSGLSSYLTSAEFAYLQSPYRLAHINTSAEMIERAHDAGMQVHVWTVNSEVDMHDAIKKGVDGILSDEILLLQRVLGGQQ